MACPRGQVKATQWRLMVGTTMGARERQRSRTSVSYEKDWISRLSMFQTSARVVPVQLGHGVKAHRQSG